MMPTYIDFFSPTGSQLLGAFSVIAIAVAFTLIGAAVGGRNRVQGADLFVGWGVSLIAFVVGGTLVSLPLSWIAGAVGIAALLSIALSFRSNTFDLMTVGNGPVFWRVLVIAAPFLLLVSGMVMSQWDEFSQWIPNALYLIRNDAFPAHDLPKSPSVFPAYPYGLPLVTFMASQLAGAIVENAGAFFNLLLVLAVAPLYVGGVRLGLGADKAWAMQWRVAALGILGVTVLSTTFVQKLVLTHYADSATAAVLAVIGFLLWRLLDLLADDDPANRGKAWALAGQCGAAIAAFLFLKQTNLVLLVFILGGAGLIALRDPAIKVMAFLKYIPALLLPGLILYLAWRHHVNTEIGAGEFSLQPRENWLVDHAFTILAKMVEIASKKAAYFIMMVALTGVSLFALVRGFSSTSRLATLAAAVFVGQTVFLWAMYIAAFGTYEGMRAASFWRYNTQLGLLGALAAANGLATLWQAKLSRRPGWQNKARVAGMVAIILAFGLPIALAEKLRFDLRPQKIHFRAVAAELAETLAPNNRVFLADPRGNGFGRMILRYELMSGVGHGRGLETAGDISVFTRLKTAEEMRKRAEDSKAKYVLIHESLPVLEQAFSTPLPQDALTLIARGEGGWSVVKSWPYPGYTEPYKMPD